VYYLLLFNFKNECRTAPHCCVYRYIACIGIIGTVYVYCTVRAQPVSYSFPCHLHSTNAPYPLRLYVVLNRRTNGRHLRDFQVVVLFRKSEGALNRKVLSPLRRLAGRLLPRRFLFDPVSIHVCPVVDKLARGHDFLGVFISSCIQYLSTNASYTASSNATILLGRQR
jgi:hypothetical protein